MNDAATIHALTQSNATLHERLAALSRQRDAFRELCVQTREAVEAVSTVQLPYATAMRLDQLDAALESALAIHR